MTTPVELPTGRTDDLIPLIAVLRLRTMGPMELWAVLDPAIRYTWLRTIADRPQRKGDELQISSDGPINVEGAWEELPRNVQRELVWRTKAFTDFLTWAGVGLMENAPLHRAEGVGA